MSLTPAPSVALADVEWRVDSKPKNGDHGVRARYVPHLNARIAARLMDEWVGPENWSDEYRTVTIAGKEALLCTLSVFYATGAMANVDGNTKPVGHWVSKQDVGVPSHTEAQKGGISDAFKRCVSVKWGAGRNVYDLPTLWAPCREYDGKAYPNDATLPDLLRQLKQRGFSDAAGRVEDSGAEDAGRAEPLPGNAPAAGDGGEAASRPTPASPPKSRPILPIQENGKPAPVSKNRRDKAKARAVALQADGVKVADEREAAGLPLIDSADNKQMHAWEELLTFLEAQIEAPFEEAK